jgi:hypothetical protein
MEISKTSRYSRNERILLGCVVVLMLVWNWVSWGFPFFWDNVLNSKIAHWYLETNFASVTVPENLDAGHPPFFSLYLAGIWKMFGRSLTIAHIAMLPFLLLLVVQFHKLMRRWLSPKAQVWAMALLFCEPTFMAQTSMISPDVALVGFYFLALNALLDGKRVLAAVAMVLMASMSFRGILMVAPLFLTDVSLAWMAGQRRPNLRKFWPYLPVALLTLLWLWVHARAVGWLFSPPPETYGGHRQVVGLGGMARNFGLVGWRFLDFGRVFVWLFVLGFGMAFGYKRLAKLPAIRQTFIVFLMPAVGLSLLLVPFSNPIGHRYFLVCYLVWMILAVAIAESGMWKWFYKLGLLFVMAGLATGNLWIYPKGVAQGWDASLAHIPMFSLAKSERVSFQFNGIDPSEVCSTFPFLANPYYTYVEDSLQPWFKDKDDSTAMPCKYLFYSNVAPGFSDEEIAELEAFHDRNGGYRMFQGASMWGIELILYVYEPPYQWHDPPNK